MSDTKASETKKAVPQKAARKPGAVASAAPKKASPLERAPALGNAAKRQERRAEHRRAALMWNAVILGTLALTVVLVIAVVIRNLRPGPLPGEQVIPDEGRGVVAEGVPVTFLHDPPSSGTHYDRGAPWGLADAPVPPGNYLNNLARGGIVILYECETDCATLEEQFRAFLQNADLVESQFNQRKVLITTYEGDLPTPIVALAWGHQLNLQSFDEATLLTWYRRFVNRGPNNGP
ncbi:MAG: DUF3105 domain-containing protein [Anaerolineales bacterium]|nr:DUF3105 domain-containing protein [Anaerolineales bacterium]